MKLERKMLQTFGIFAWIAGAGIGLIYCIFAGKSYMEEQYNWLARMAVLTAGRFEDMASRSKSVCTMLLSDPDTRQAVLNLARENDDEPQTYESLYFGDDYSVIRGSIDTFFVYESFRRILYYNEIGDVITGTNLYEREMKPGLSWEDFPELKTMKEGEIRITPCRDDPWGRGQNQQVMSFIKKLAGTNLGVIEIQWNKEDLDEMLYPADNAYDVMIYDQKGTLLYSSLDNPGQDYFKLTHLQEEPEGTFYLKSENIAVAYENNEELGITTVVAEHVNFYGIMLAQILPVLLMLLLLFSAFALIYIRFTTKRLVKPVVSLRNLMERTELSNMTDENAEKELFLESIEEVQDMYHSFENMMQRLSNTMEREKYLSVLQLQAQFDLLQAQINPHFLYNVLNIIAAKGMQANDESICDICSCLGRMLRYSTGTRTKMGTILEEKQYLQMYFTLLKYRYEHRLEYRIEIDPEIEKQELPKIVLQQIVENSIKHGYAGSTDIIQIYVTGTGTVDDWKLKVHDNGVGFAEEKIEQLNLQMSDIRRRLSTEREHIEMEIGGMGLINTYARLYLVYGEQLSFTICSDEKGTDVEISVRSERGGKRNAEV